MLSSRMIRAQSLEEAARLLAELGSKASLLAGASDLVPKLRRGLPAAERWIDITHIQGPDREIWLEGDEVVLGALATFADMASSPLLRQALPCLVEASSIMGSEAIRVRGTLGGNLANASPAGDSIPPLLAGDARVVLLRAGGRRELPLTDFFRGPGKTVLEAGELIAQVRLPLLPQARSCFVRVGTRESHEISKVSVALRLNLEDGRLRQVRLAMGAVAPTVIRSYHAEEALEGQVLTPLVARRAAEAAAGDARPITDVRSTAEYRADMCRELTLMALGKLCG